MINFKCPRCGKKFKEEMNCCETKGIDCPKCGEPIVISTMQTKKFQGEEK